MSEAPIRVLHLEDDPDDAELILHSLRSSGLACDVIRVDTQTDFEARLRDFKPHIVLADHNLPTFNGSAALKLSLERDPDLPFIFVSGKVGEEWAVDVIRQGATDYVLKDRLGRLSVAIGRALRERREKERRTEMESRLREIARTVREVFWILSATLDRVLYVSASFERIWGRPAAEPIGRSPAELLDYAHPDDRARVEEAFKGGFLTGDAELEHRIVRPDGGVRWVRHRSYPIRGPGGDVLRVIVTSEDVTETRELREQFLQSQKMEAVGRLAGGVAHDFNNLLTIICGNAELALERLKPDDPLRELVEQMAEAGEKAAMLTRQLLTFSRKQPVEAKVLDLRRLLRGLDKMLQRLIGSDVELASDVDDRLWSVYVDPGHLELALVNLVVNARDAMPRGGRITIAARNVATPTPAGRDPLPPGDYVDLSVGDTGCGMGPEVLAHIFEPFFTTKDVGKGTGLGLSTVHGIVRQSGGSIRVESVPGKGSVFHLFLPRGKDEPMMETRRAARPGAGALEGTETILLAEDSETVRRLCEAILKSAGYSVISVANGEEAVKTLRDDPRPIHLLLADVVMPKLGGPDVAARAGKYRESIKTLLMSGYPQGDPRLGIGASYVPKPFTREALLRKVREALSR
jgi:two-component system cell cycle sensor histidine kinase/response regulator CckA